jgi:hypothetical protein
MSKSYMHNMIIWHDGTLNPYPNHNQCTGIWIYDGQVFVHKCPQKRRKPIAMIRKV